METLAKRGFESDPVKEWKESQAKGSGFEEAEEEAGTDDDESVASGSGPDFGYLLNMAILSLTKEKKDELLKQRDAKVGLSSLDAYGCSLSFTVIFCLCLLLVCLSPLLYLVISTIG